MPPSLVVTKGSNTFSAISGAMPVPVSATNTSTSPGDDNRVSIASSRSGEALIASTAFRIRLISTC